MLDLLAEHEQVTASDMARTLIRREAKRVLDLDVADLASRSGRAR